MKIVRFNWFTTFLLIVLFGVGAFGALWRLDKPLLWADEAETALIGRNTMRFGYPTPWDGTTLVTQQEGADAHQIGDALVWTWHPPLQYYLIGISFKLFGESPWSARVPFALFGFLGICALAGGAWTMSKNARFVLIVTTLAVFSVPLMLYLRQARYYGLLFFAGALVAWGLAKIRRGEHGAITLLGLGTLVAVFSNTVAGIVLTLVAATFALWEPRDRARRAVHLLAALAPTILFAVGWLLLSDPLQTLNRQIAGQPNVPTVWTLLENYHRSFFPPLAWAAIAFLLARPREKEDEYKWIVIIAPLIVGLTVWTIAAVGLPPFTRYLLAAAPFTFLVLGYVLWRIFEWSGVVGVLMIAIVAGTTLATNLPSWSREALTRAHGPFIPQEKVSYLPQFIAELQNPFPGTLEAISVFLKHAAPEGDRILTNYEREAIIFATGRNVLGAKEDLALRPQWLIPRPNPFLWEFETIPPQYEPFVLDAPNTLVENSPELGEHYFGTPPTQPPLVIYHLRRAPLKDGFDPATLLRVQDSTQSQIEKLKNEMISRHDDETVPCGTVRRSNEVMSHFLASRCGRSVWGSSSALLVAHVPKGTQHSSRLESNPHSLCSTDSGLNPALLDKITNDAFCWK